MKRIAAVLLVLSILMLSGCGSLTRTFDVIGQIADVLINGSDSNQGGGEESLSGFRQVIAENSAVCGVAYLGFYEGGFNEIITTVTATDSGRVNGYISQINEEHFVKQNGSELYSIITADKADIVKVYEQHYDESSETNIALGEKLLEVTDGSPILILGNESEILPNIYIEIESSDGETYGFSPRLSGMDGSLYVPEYVLDLTVYNDPIVYGGSASAGGTADWISGIWYCETNTTDGPVSQIVQFTEDGTAEYSCGYANSEVSCMFTGTWTDNDDGTISVIMVGGDVIWNDDGIKYDTSESFNGVFEWELNNGCDLVLTHISGDTLIATDEYSRYSFTTLLENAVG